MENAKEPSILFSCCGINAPSAKYLVYLNACFGFRKNAVSNPKFFARALALALRVRFIPGEQALFLLPLLGWRLVVMVDVREHPI